MGIVLNISYCNVSPRNRWPLRPFRPPPAPAGRNKVTRELPQEMVVKPNVFKSRLEWAPAASCGAMRRTESWKRRGRWVFTLFAPILTILSFRSHGSNLRCGDLFFSKNAALMPALPRLPGCQQAAGQRPRRPSGPVVWRAPQGEGPAPEAQGPAVTGTLPHPPDSHSLFPVTLRLLTIRLHTFADLRADVVPVVWET